MNRNRLKILLAFGAALILAGCGAAAEKGGGERVAAAPSPDKQSPARQAEVAATPAASNASVGSTPAAAVAAAPQDGAKSGGSRGRGDTPPAAMPTPVIGSGGNDFFLFTQARAAVNADPELRAANLVIEVKEGVLTLSGAVASAAHKSKAEQLVRGSGAKTVRNQLRVAAGS